MRLIDEDDVSRIKSCVTSKEWQNFAKESYYKAVENDDFDLIEINYKSMPELEAEILKIKGDIDKTLLRNIVLSSAKARAKYERELDEGLYEYAEEHKNDIPAFIYVF